MAVPVLHDPTDPVADLIEQLRRSRGRPEAALRRAVPFAAAVAPAVVEIVEKATAGVYLTPRQSNLLFWGVHVLAAGRRTELCKPLLRLLRNTEHDRLDELFGDAITEGLKRVLISVFNGDADALTEAIMDPSVDGFLRWGFFDALARLTFDGLISRDRTHQLLDRFERERLAEPGDPAWEGWTEAVVYLGFELLHDRLRQGWRDDLFDETICGPDHWERQIALVQAMRPGDPSLMDRERLSPITDIEDAVGWVETDAKLAAKEAVGREGDPAAGILAGYERGWLEGFLSSHHVSDTAMTVAGVDGYFTALAVYPSEVDRTEYWPALWNYDAETGAEPAYDSDEQERYVTDLLARYLEATERRVAAGFPHPASHLESADEEGDEWAAGFLRGVALRTQSWGEHAAADEDCRLFMSAVYILATGNAARAEQGLSRRERIEFFKKLPGLLLNLYRGWRGLAPIRSSRIERWKDEPGVSRRIWPKVGRNEPCPCGSGKKFKRCCGDPASTVN